MSMHTRKPQSLLLLAVALCLTIGVIGCKSDGDPPVVVQPPTDDGNDGRRGPTGEKPPLPNLSAEQLEALFENKDTRLQSVYFDYNSFDLRADALDTLSANARKIKDYPQLIIMVHGHCDERGTQAYNLTLGEKRALATRAHLINLGVSGDKIITVSHGKEQPADPGHSESAWAKNRRCEFGEGRL